MDLKRGNYLWLYIMFALVASQSFGILRGEINDKWVIISLTIFCLAMYDLTGRFAIKDSCTVVVPTKELSSIIDSLVSDFKSEKEILYKNKIISEANGWQIKTCSSKSIFAKEDNYFTMNEIAKSLYVEKNH